jgi:hypothetical protein
MLWVPLFYVKWYLCESCHCQRLSWSNLCTGLERSWGFQEDEVPRFHDNRHMKVIRPHLPPPPPEIFLESIFVTSWVVDQHKWLWISVLHGSSGSWLIIMLCIGEVYNSIFDLWIGYYDWKLRGFIHLSKTISGLIYNMVAVFSFVSLSVLHLLLCLWHYNSLS